MLTEPRPIKCLIVDDEPLAQVVIETHLKQIPQLILVGKCNSAIEAFEVLHKEEIDLLFLDINMPIISGINFIKSLKIAPKVIFTTAYTEYAVEAFALDVVDYLVKPIAFERFEQAVQKALQALQVATPIASKTIPTSIDTTEPISNTKNYTFIKVDGKLVKLKYDEIVYIEGMKDYLKIVCKQQQLVVHSTFKNMEEILPQNLFVRVHKSYIIALEHIKTIDGNIILMNKEHATIPIGQSYKDELFAKLNT